MQLCNCPEQRKQINIGLRRRSGGRGGFKGTENHGLTGLNTWSPAGLAKSRSCGLVTGESLGVFRRLTPVPVSRHSASCLWIRRKLSAIAVAPCLPVATLPTATVMG